jgi:hypothetical protein
MDDKSYEFHDPIQYKLKIQKDVFMNKLKEIPRITEKMMGCSFHSECFQLKHFG